MNNLTLDKWAKADAFNEGFDDAYDLEPCEPLSDISECREAYFQGYADGIESWIKIEYPTIHHLGMYEGYGEY